MSWVVSWEDEFGIFPDSSSGAGWTGREGLASAQELWRKGVFSWRRKRVGSERPCWSCTCFSKCCYWKWDAEGRVLLGIKLSSHWRNPILPWGETGHKGQAISTGSCRWVGGDSRVLVGQPWEPAHGWEDARMRRHADDSPMSATQCRYSLSEVQTSPGYKWYFQN